MLLRAHSAGAPRSQRGAAPAPLAQQHRHRLAPLAARAGGGRRAGGAGGRRREAEAGEDSESRNEPQTSYGGGGGGADWYMEDGRSTSRYGVPQEQFEEEADEGEAAAAAPTGSRDAAGLLPALSRPRGGGGALGRGPREEGSDAEEAARHSGGETEAEEEGGAYGVAGPEPSLQLPSGLIPANEEQRRYLLRQARARACCAGLC